MLAHRQRRGEYVNEGRLILPSASSAHLADRWPQRCGGLLTTRSVSPFVNDRVTKGSAASSLRHSADFGNALM